MMLFTVTGCEQALQNLGINFSSVAGIYTVTSIDTGDQQDYAGMIERTFEDMKIILNKDKTGSVSKAEDSVFITWSKDGNILTLVNPEEADEPEVMTINGSDLVLSSDGVTVVFSKLK